MGESSACLAHSFSQPSPSSSEEKKGNPLQRALTTSISFGRFMSESLDWEKWSAFTHNRYLEEVGKYSKPGSVAEKKAYFEAHFKRRRAAALLEQQNAASDATACEANTETKVEDGTSSDMGLAHKHSCVVTTNVTEGGIQNSYPVIPVGQKGSYDASAERTADYARPGGVEKFNEPNVLMKNPELTNHLENDGCIDDAKASKEEDKAINKDDSTVRNSASSSEKKHEVSPILFANGSASKCVPSPSVKSIMPVQLKNSDKTPDSKSNARDSSNKRRSYATSLHMSINFASCSGETQKATSPVPQNIANTRLSRAPSKKYKNRTLPQTSTTASVTGIFKRHLANPQPGSRNVKIHGDSISQSRTVDGKVQSSSTNCSKSSNTFGSKARLPTVASPFTFKSEERSAKRKEFFQKLEQKLQSKATEKQQQHAKPQVLARNSFKDLRNSTAKKTTKNAEAPQIDLPTSLTKQIPRVKPSFPKGEERASLKVQDTDLRPPWRLSIKIEGSNDAIGKHKRPPIYNTGCYSKKSTNENASPNIQL